MVHAVGAQTSRLWLAAPHTYTWALTSKVVQGQGLQQDEQEGDADLHANPNPHCSNGQHQVLSGAVW